MDILEKKATDLLKKLADNVDSLSDISVSVEIHNEPPDSSVTHVNGSIKGLMASKKGEEVKVTGISIVVSPDDMRWAEYEGDEEE